MIPISTFNLIFAAALLLLLYSVVDNKNNLYANIVSAVVSGILFQWLSQAATIGAVSFTSASVGDVAALFGWIAFGYAIFMSADAIFEVVNAEKSNTKPEDDEV